MTQATTEIERIVRQVLAELQHAGAGDCPNFRVNENGTVPFDAPAGELRLAAQLITMSDLSGRLDGVRRLLVSPQAILTPAARDELARRNVDLVRTAAEKHPAAGQLRLLLVAAATSFDPAPLADSLAADGVAVRQQRMDCLVAATDYLAGELVKPDTAAALVSPHAAAALCLANRHPGVRAVQGLDAPAAAAATAGVGANLLVLDPSIGTFFQWKQMLGEFCRRGVRPCPEALQKRLG